MAPKYWSNLPLESMVVVQLGRALRAMHSCRGSCALETLGCSCRSPCCCSRSFRSSFLLPLPVLEDLILQRLGMVSRRQREYWSRPRAAFLTRMPSWWGASEGAMDGLPRRVSCRRDKVRFLPASYEVETNREICQRV